MKKLLFAIGILAAGCAASQMLTSCDDATYSIGSALVEDKVEVVMDSSFTLTGQAVRSTRVQSRTTTQLIGRLDAKGYGKIQSEIVTQFMPGMVMNIDSFSAADIDSVKLIMHMSNGAYTGDSLLPMGLKVYPLKKALPSPIYSDFNPTDYYDPSTCWGSTVYSATALGQPDSIFNLKSRSIQVTLPLQFGIDLYNEYKNNVSTFSTPQAFAQWFPGLYIANSFGNGRITRIAKSYITMFYHEKGKSESTGNDTVFNKANTLLAVTPEIITNNDITYAMAADLEQRALAGQALIVAPTGYDVAIEFPAQAIFDSYKQQAGPIALLNGLTLEIPVEEVPNIYGIKPPQYVLLIKEGKMAEFFAKNGIADNINSFYATYDATNHTYTFSDMSGYAAELIKKDAVSADDSRFIICPIELTTESSAAASGYYGYYGTSTSTATVTGMVPYVTNPVMARLRLDKAKIKLTFSKQTI